MSIKTVFQSSKFLSFCLIYFILVPYSIANETVPEGHSHQGHAFNQGPRQRAYLMENTGTVHFPITCNWKIGQDYFNQGLGQLHGFWYYEAERSFRQIIANDPTCAMAYWGIAMANWENEGRAKEFITIAQKNIHLVNNREKLYIDAQYNYLHAKKKDIKKRNSNLIKDIEAIIDEYPDDVEAKAILAARLWQFSSKGNPINSYEAVDALIQQVLVKSPKHPVHHYRIHLWDKRNAKRALDSAAILGSTAPAIAHMWHMPGHIYSKLHRYELAAWHQQASARIDHSYMSKSLIIPDQIHNYAHNNEWLVRNWIHLGDAESALQMAKSLLSNPRHPKLNQLDGKAHSYNYGRKRLAEVLEKFELWELALELTKGPWFDSVNSPKNEHKRIRMIGLAHFHLGNKIGLERELSRLNQLVEVAESRVKSSEINATEKAEKENKSDEEKASLAEAAKKSAEGLLKQIQKSQSEIDNLLQELNGNIENSLENISKSSRPMWAQALHLLKHKKFEKAEKISLKAIEKYPNQTLPLAAHIEVLHAQDKTKETKIYFEKLQSISSQIDLSVAPFKRLEPIIQSLGYSKPWKSPNNLTANREAYPCLDSLGPIHWMPPVAADFVHRDKNDNQVSLSQYLGKTFLLIFYLGKDCIHCNDQLSAIAKSAPQLSDIDLPVLAISTDSVDKLKESQQKYASKKDGFPFPLIADPEKVTFRKYTAYDDFENIPLHGTFLISAEGRVLWSDISAEPFMDIDFLISESIRLRDLHKNFTAQ